MFQYMKIVFVRRNQIIIQLTREVLHQNMTKWNMTELIPIYPLVGVVSSQSRGFLNRMDWWMKHFNNKTKIQHAKIKDTTF